MPKIAALAATAMLFASLAFAQTTWMEAEDAEMVPTLNVSVDAVEDTDGAGPRGSKIGEVVGSSASAPSALIIDFSNESNDGNRDDVIPLDQFTMGSGTLVLNTKPADVANYPAYDD